MKKVVPGKKTIRPSSFRTESFTTEEQGLDGATSFSVSRSPSSSLPPSTMAMKSSALIKSPVDPIRAWFCGLRFAYFSRKGSTSLRYMDDDSCLCPYFLRMCTALNQKDRLLFTCWTENESKESNWRYVKTSRTKIYITIRRASCWVPSALMLKYSISSFAYNVTISSLTRL